MHGWDRDIFTLHQVRGIIEQDTLESESQAETFSRGGAVKMPNQVWWRNPSSGV